MKHKHALKCISWKDRPGNLPDLTGFLGADFVPLEELPVNDKTERLLKNIQLNTYNSQNS